MMREHAVPDCLRCREIIRELEAALERARMQRNQLETHQTPYVLELQARAEKAEARVAELEGQITRWRRRYPNDVSEEAYQLLLAARPNASDAIAREREAE